MPPDAMMEAVPLQESQVASVPEAVAVSVEMVLLMVTDAVAVQPLASVTVPVYVPEQRPDRVPSGQL